MSSAGTFAAARQLTSMAPSGPHKRRLCNVTLLCALLAAAAAQSCVAAGLHRSATQPHARKRSHHRPTRKAGSKQPHAKPHAKPHRTPPHKAVPRSVPAARKPAPKPAAEQKRVTGPSAAAAGAQLTVRTCGTPPQNQTTRVAVHSALARRMEQRAQSRTAPITVRVFFAIIQASRPQAEAFSALQRYECISKGADIRSRSCCAMPTFGTAGSSSNINAATEGYHCPRRLRQRPADRSPDVRPQLRIRRRASHLRPRRRAAHHEPS